MSEGRAFLNQVMDEVRAAHARRFRGLRVGQGAAQVVRVLTAAAGRGNAAADEAAELVAVAGAEFLLRKRAKQDRQRVRISRNGTVEAYGMPGSYGTKKRDGARQLQFFIDMTWDEFEATLAAMTQQRDVLGTRVEIFQGLRPYRARFPESVTPREALLLAGQDPAEFEVTI